MKEVFSQTKEIIPFDIKELTETNIALMQTQCEELVIDEMGRGYVEVKAAHVKVKGLKRAVTGRHKELKTEHLKECQILDGERRRIYGLLDPIIDTLASKRQVENDRKTEIRKAKERKEQDRIDDIRAKIDGIKQWCYQGIEYGVPSPDIQRLVPMLVKTLDNLTEEDFAEYLPEVRDCLLAVIEQTEKALEARLQFEKNLEAARIETKRLSEIKKQQEVEQEKIDTERHKIEEEKAKIEQVERDRKIKEEAEADTKVNAEKQIQEAKEAQIKAEIEAKEAKARAEREAVEKIKREAREKARLEALKPDVEKLLDFAQSLQDVIGPELEDAKAVRILNSAKTLISEAVEVIRDGVAWGLYG